MSLTRNTYTHVISASSLLLTAEMLANIESLDYQVITPIQTQSLPLILEGKDKKLTRKRAEFFYSKIMGEYGQIQLFRSRLSILGQTPSLCRCRTTHSKQALKILSEENYGA